jgi:hypothetical protein
MIVGTLKMWGSKVRWSKVVVLGGATWRGEIVRQGEGIGWSEAIRQRGTIGWEGKYKDVVWNEVIGWGEGVGQGVTQSNKVRQNNKT